MSGFVVIMRTGAAPYEFVAYGPAPTRESADEFAAFLNAEVDPATVVPLRSPTAELLGFWRTFRDEIARNAAGEATPPGGVHEHTYDGSGRCWCEAGAVAHERLQRALATRARRRGDG